MNPSMENPPKSVFAIAIDDNWADLELMQHKAAAVVDPAIEVAPFSEVDQAIAHMKVREPDILLIDFSLRGLTGIEVLGRIRAAGVRSPAILLTGQGDEELVVSSMHAGFSDYLSKGVLSDRSLKRSISNVTEKFQLERQAEMYREQLEVLVEDLKTKNREISSFYHTLAHELKTPLTATREFVSIVKDGLLGDVNVKQADLLSSAMSSCDQLRRCIDDLFDVSRIETGKLGVNCSRAKLGEVVRQAYQCLIPQAKKQRIDLVLQLADELPDCNLDEHRIHQVVSNLVGNALKFTDRNGQITVSCKRGSEGFQEVSVRDNGKGMAPEDLEQVFDRLFQAEGNAAITGGMGIGLHLCRELVRLHGGDITAKSRLGHGSQFTFTIPAAA